MASIDDQIKEIEEEIHNTPYNKNTQHHIGKLKAKLARLKDEQEKRRAASGGTGKSYAVKKSGNATVSLVGFPSVGKSTLLNNITDATSEVGRYDFTTLEVLEEMEAELDLGDDELGLAEDDEPKKEVECPECGILSEAGSGECPVCGADLNENR